MKKQVLKTVFLKTMIVVSLILAASLLVTCDLLFPPDDTSGEYTDVEYTVVGAKGSERVKSVKLYLKPDNLAGDVKPGPGTYGVKKSAEQRRIERALTLEGARMSHDYFEVVFMASATSVARAAWEIGQPAGISGVNRQTGTNYSTPAPGTSSPTATGSTIFVGRKTGRTLLGVGYLTQVDNKDITDNTTPPIADGTESVTFTVSPLATWLGFDWNSTSEVYEVNTTRPDVNPPTGKLAAGATFVTATTDTAGTTGFLDAAPENTKGELYVPFTGVTFPIYHLPSAKATNWPTAVGTATQLRVNAIYMVGGLTLDTVYSSGTGNIYGHFPADPGLTEAVRIWGLAGQTGSWTVGDPDADPVVPSTTDTTTLKGGLQFIKRTPAFMFEGRNYEITQTYTDKITQVDVPVQVAASPMYADKPFPANGMELYFTLSRGTSGGIFAITFQVPVYALTVLRAGNTGLLPPEKWWIRPDYSQYQYLLDNGKDSGGAVLIGTDVEGGADWIQINTQGIGFSNE